MPWGNTIRRQQGNYNRMPQTGSNRAPQNGPNRVPQANSGRAPQAGFNRAPQAGSNRMPQNALNRVPQAGSNAAPQAGYTTQQTQLPDGVQIKPLDAGTMKLLQGMGMNMPVQQAPVQQSAPGNSKEQLSTSEQNTQTAPEQNAPIYDENALASELIFNSSLSELIQDEHNSSRFYAYLSEIAPSSAYADYLRREGDNCGERVNKLNRIFQQSSSSGVFNPAEVDINTQIAFNSGVNWAVAVESHALQKFGALYENAPDERTARSLFAHACGKLSHILMLILIMQNKEVTV